MKRLVRLMKGKVKGFTLIEIVVVLGVIAILSAILIPITANYLSEAKSGRAKKDVEMIANAILTFNRDTGEFPRWVNIKTAATDPDETKLSDARFLALHTKDGQVPEVETSGTMGGWTTDARDDDEPNFTTPAADGDGDTLDHHLNNNTPGNLTTSAYKTTGGRAWKGPYLSNIKSDPWGNKYFVNVQYLIGAPGGTVPSGATHAGDIGRFAFVLSAGPNEVIETIFDQAQTTAASSVGGDDIVFQIK